jgi:hypothetical protein
MFFLASLQKKIFTSQWRKRAVTWRISAERLVPEANYSALDNPLR